MALGMMYRSATSIVLSISLLVIFFFLCCSSSWNVVNGYGMVGGKREVQDVKNKKEIQDLGRFSVEEYNRKNRHYQQGQGWGFRGDVGRGIGREGPLEFKEVVKAQTQVVSGFQYYLTIAASQDGFPKTYDAVVIMKPWVHSKRLITFAPSSTN